MYYSSGKTPVAAPLLKKIDSLAVRIYPSSQEMALAAAASARDYLQNLARQKSHLAAILATGNSQIAFLAHLTQLSGIDWQRITLFHLDEFLGIPGDHPASFQTYFRQRVESRVTLAEFHYIQGDCWEPARECDRYAQLLAAQAIDFCCLGVGQNGHLAFNEPEVANFRDNSAIKIVKLAESTRQAQVGDSLFP
ncbi:MAG: glucosamine-6-phosphate deaminase, partial [Chloroflexaceae bacterium]|nr:glucosamine-6-phosphate deaminase [Chloroflexaceae bacterium]